MKNVTSLAMALKLIHMNVIWQVINVVFITVQLPAIMLRVAIGILEYVH